MAQIPLSPEIRSLPIPDRLQLVEQIWDSIVQDEKVFEMTDRQKSELDRRISAHEASPGRGQPWEVVKKRLIGE